MQTSRTVAYRNSQQNLDASTRQLLIRGDSIEEREGFDQKKLQDFTNVLDNFAGFIEENKLPEITNKVEGVQIVKKLEHIKSLISPIEDGPDISEEVKEEVVLSDSDSS